jgi:hypothetical protein
MIRVFGPLHVSDEDWPLWRRTVQPWIRMAKVLLVFDLLMLWACFVITVAKHVRFE